MFKSILLDTTEITSATNSASQLLRYADNCAVQIITSVVGEDAEAPDTASVKLQASNDNVNWSDISNTTNNITAVGNIVINLQDIGYKWIRAVFAIADGTMTCKVIATGKERKV
jgi:hypothetical protein